MFMNVKKAVVKKMKQSQIMFLLRQHQHYHHFQHHRRLNMLFEQMMQINHFVMNQKHKCKFHKEQNVVVHKQWEEVEMGHKYLKFHQ